MERALRRLFSAGLVDVPPSEVPYLVHPWVVAIDRLRAEGWNPQHTNEETVLACLRGREPTSAWKATVAAAGGRRPRHRRARWSPAYCAVAQRRSA